MHESVSLPPTVSHTSVELSGLPERAHDCPDGMGVETWPHWLQLPSPLLLNWPAAHDTHEEAPGRGWPIPAGHATQEESPGTEAKDPGAHALHKEELVPGWKVPGLHSRQADMPKSPENMPGAQAVQAVDPVDQACVPAGQGVQAELEYTGCLAENVPAKQLTQLPAER